MNHSKWILAGVALLSLTGSALADTVFTSQSAFNAAVPAATTYSFFALPGGQDVGTSFTLGPATFMGSDLVLYNDGGYGNGQTYLGIYDTNPLASISGGTYAIGFNVGAYNAPVPSQVYVNGVLVDTLAVPVAPTSTFFGYMSDSPITSVGFALNTENVDGPPEFDVLNLEVGNPAPAPTPEPSSLALLGSALLGGAATLRRRILRA